MEVRHRQGAGGLPAPTHSFVGRDRELEKISTLLLGSVRLITLAGPGGIGKTHLASEAVRRFGKAETKKTRVHWVRLVRLAKNSDVTAVAEEIAHAVIEADFSGRSVWEALVDTLTRTDTTRRTPRTVLVLDNCEHVLTGVGPLIADLFDAIPELTVLATSREPTGWVDEYLIMVPPLSYRYALALFRQRAELTDHPVTGKDQTAIVAEICRHINNHPLYIQLAAARLRHQPLTMILRGLTGHADDTRLRWSHGPHVDADPRHRAVVDVIAWSYELCSDKERLLFDRLSVFAAGYATHPDDIDGNAVLEVGADLEAVESICCDEETSDAQTTLARQEIEGLLERLVDQSLVTMHMTPTTVRYSLVESLRVFAQQQLHQRATAEVDEPARLADRHRRYYHDKIASAATNFSPERQDLLGWARTAWANTLTAIETSITTPGQATVGLEICLGLIALRVPLTSGSVGEIRQWTQRCLDATRTMTPQPIELQIGAMAAISYLAVIQGLTEDAERMLEDCVAACIPDPDTRSNWRDTAETDIDLPAPVELAWGMELMFACSDARAIAVLTRAREKFDILGDCATASLSEVATAIAASLLGTAQQSHEITQRCFNRMSLSGALWEKSWAGCTRSIALTRHGNPTEALDALALARDSMTYQLATGDQWLGAWLPQSRTWSLARIISDSIAAGNPDHERVAALATEIAHLVGGTNTLRARLGIAIETLGPLADESDKAVAVARQVLGPEAFTTAEARGARLRPEHNEVQRLALGTLTLDTPAERYLAVQASTSRWHELSPAERQVAILAAAGWTNTAIAARRGKSARTIDAQIAAILQKLAIASRRDIIEYIPRNVIDQVHTETTR